MPTSRAARLGAAVALALLAVAGILAGLLLTRGGHRQSETITPSPLEDVRMSIPPIRPAFAAPPADVRCAKQMIDAWYQGGRIEGAYPLRCYGAALGLLPPDGPPDAYLVAGIRRAYTARAEAVFWSDQGRRVPPWLRVAEEQALDRVFGGARPIRTYRIWYPRKIAVVFEFDRVVICGPCSGPTAANVPRGRAIWVGFDRRTHRLGGAIRFCEVRGSWPPLAWCLRR
jgi:hypothetical protein